MVSIDKYIKLINEGYSLDVIFVLSKINEGLTIEPKPKKIKSILNLLQRKNLIEEGKITYQGKKLLVDLEEFKDEDFENWWKVYPSSNTFEYKKRVFFGTQNKRIKKSICKTLFAKWVNSGISSLDIIEATKYHFSIAKELSFKEGKNQFSFISNSERYLRNKDFEPYIEIYKKGLNINQEDDQEIKQLINTKDLF